MSGLYRAAGVVLRTYKLGEADRIIVFCTKERGKVRAVAKGVRKTKSKFGSRLEPTSHVNIQLYEGRGDLDIVTQVESIDSYRTLREDFDSVRRAIALLEAVDNVVQEGEPSLRLYQMLVGALRSLNEGASPMIVATFFWKLLAYEGLHPVLDQCASCGEQENLVAFDLVEGGVLCANCRRGAAMSQETLSLLRRTLQGDLARVLKEEPSAATFELEKLAEESLENHLERRLRSRHVLDRA